MAFFSLLKPRSDALDVYRAERCHINVWSLPGWLGHRPMLFDVGLMFTPTNGALEEIEMALPVRATPRIRDLVGTIGNSEVAALLFGKSYDGGSDSKLMLKLDEGGVTATKEIRLVGIDEKASQFFYEDPHLVGVKLALIEPVPQGRTAYIRARFVIDHPGTMWRWQRVLGRRNGALIDFRVPDPREELQHDRSPIEKRAKSVEELDAFFILPERFRLQSSNPKLTYTRTLEGEVWRPYLRRSVNGISRFRPGHQRLMVHRWHPLESDGTPRPVGRDRPFRGFLQFDRAPAFRAPTDLLLGVLLTSGVFYLLFRPLTLRRGVGDSVDWSGRRLADLVDLAVSLIAVIGIVAIASFGYSLLAKYKNLPRIFQPIKRWFKKAEYLWFKIWS